MKAQADIGKVTFPYIVEVCMGRYAPANTANPMWSSALIVPADTVFPTIKSAKQVALDEYNACDKERHVRIRDTRDGSVRWVKLAKGW